MLNKSVVMQVCALALSVFLLPSTSEARPAGHCPPGLAKKAVPCVPPGQVRNLWTIGAPLPANLNYVIIHDFRRFGLPRAARGTQYVRVDNDILRIAIESARVIESVQTIGRLLN